MMIMGRCFSIVMKSIRTWRGDCCFLESEAKRRGQVLFIGFIPVIELLSDIIQNN
jgi:hypothetical protein